MSQSDLLQHAAKSKHCATRTCMGIGKWLPVLSVRIRGQLAVERPSTLGIPMFLCDRCKGTFEVSNVLTPVGKAKWMIAILAKRGRRPNWDTLTVEWRTDDDAKRVIAPDQS